MMQNTHAKFWNIGYGICIGLVGVAFVVGINYHINPSLAQDEIDESTALTTISSLSSLNSTDQPIQIKPGGLPQLQDKADEDKVEATSAAPLIVNHAVPFTPQAPFGNWEDPRQDYGCEEASLLMSIHWVLDKPIDREQALEHIIEMTEWELTHFEEFHDTSVADTYRVLTEYFNYHDAVVYSDVTKEMIQAELNKGRILVAPIDGQIANNPNFSGNGPPKHMLVITGYDDGTQEFITNDPGTRNGEGFRYDYENFMASLQDYDTGYDEPRHEVRTAMISIGK